MKPAPYTLKSFTEGDTWKGLQKLKVLIGGLPPVDAIEDIRIEFGRNGEIGAVLSLMGGEITLHAGGEPNEFAIPKVRLPLAHGVWRYDLEVFYAGDWSQTYMNGSIQSLPGPKSPAI